MKKYLLAAALAVGALTAVPAAQAAAPTAGFSALPQNVRDSSLPAGKFEPASIPCCGYSQTTIRAATALGPTNVAAWGDADINVDLMIGANFWQKQGRTLCAPVRYYLSDNPPGPGSSGGIWALTQRSSCAIYLDRDAVYMWGAHREGNTEINYKMQRWMCGMLVHEMGHLAGLLHPDDSEAHMYSWVMGYVFWWDSPLKVGDCARWAPWNAPFPAGD